MPTTHDDDVHRTICDAQRAAIRIRDHLFYLIHMVHFDISGDDRALQILRHEIDDEYDDEYKKLYVEIIEHIITTFPRENGEWDLGDQ